MSAGLDGLPAGEPNCRFGYTEHHAAYALVHLSVLGWFLYAARRVPSLLRGLISGGALFAVTFHALVGGACSSAAVTAAVHAHFPSSPFLVVHIIHLVVTGMLSSAVAVHFIRLEGGEGAQRSAKLGFLGANTLASLFAIGSWCARGVTNDTMQALHSYGPI